VIRYDTATETPMQGLVVIDENGDFEEIYEPLTDPLILQYLSLRSQTRYKTPVLYDRRWFRKFLEQLPLAPNLTTAEFLPTKALVLLEILRDYFPRHQLVVSDFFKLPDTIDGVDAPVVQTRYKQTMVPCSTYMVQPGYFDIFFPTNFQLFKDIYQLVCRAGEIKDQKSDIEVLSQKEFLLQNADLTRTKTKSGENPMLLYYENVKFFLT